MAPPTTQWNAWNSGILQNLLASFIFVAGVLALLLVLSYLHARRLRNLFAAKSPWRVIGKIEIWLSLEPRENVDEASAFPDYSELVAAEAFRSVITDAATYVFQKLTIPYDLPPLSSVCSINFADPEAKGLDGLQNHMIILGSAKSNGLARAFQAHFEKELPGENGKLLCWFSKQEDQDKPAPLRSVNDVDPFHKNHPNLGVIQRRRVHGKTVYYVAGSHIGGTVSAMRLLVSRPKPVYQFFCLHPNGGLFVIGADSGERLCIQECWGLVQKETLLKFNFDGRFRDGKPCSKV